MEPRQQLFVDHFLVDLNATHAAELAGYSAPKTAGSRLLANIAIRQSIRAALDARAAEVNLSARDVLLRYMAIANADPNELQQLRVHCCRYCHGESHRYQWRSEEEWAEAVEKAVHQHEEAMKRWMRRKGDEEAPAPLLVLPKTEGGFDFDAKLAPIEECPKCDGRGETHVVFADTRTLSRAGRMLYRGVKKTKDGIEMLMADQDKAHEMLGRHFGLFNDKLIHITPGGGGGLVSVKDLEVLDDADLEALEQINAKIEARRAQKQLAHEQSEAASS